MIVMFSNDPSEQVFKERFSMIYKCGEPIMEQVGCMPYPNLNTLGNAGMTAGDRKALRVAHVTHLNISNVRKVHDSLIEFTNENPTTNQSFISFEFHGTEKFASIPTNSTAFGHRKPFYNVVIGQRWTNEQDDKIVDDWSKNIQEIINRDGTIVNLFILILRVLWKTIQIIKEKS